MAVRQNNRVATPAPKSKEKTLFRFVALPQETEKVSVRSVRAKSEGGSRTIRLKIQ